MNQQQEVPLIPRQLLFGNPDRAAPQISRDGTMISYISPVDGVLNVWVAPVDDLDSARPVTHDTARGVRMYFWAYTNEHVLYLQDTDGDENWHVYSVDLSTDETIDLTPLDNVQAQIQAVSKDFPGEIVVGINDRDAQLHDVYRIDISTGKRDLIQQNEGFAEFVVDDDYNVRFAMRLTPEGGSEILQPTAEGGWELFMAIGPDDLLTTSPAGFDKTGRTVYMIDSRGRDTAALTSINLDTGEQKTIAQDSRADVGDTLIHPTEKSVQAVSFTYERKQWQALDEMVKADLNYLGTVADGEIEIVSRSLDDKIWIVMYVMDNGPVRYYLYDRESNDARFLFTNRRALEGLSLAKMHPVVISSRDGLNLVSYYSLPVGSDRNGDGKPDEPLPTVLYVHGGPWARDHWGYEPIHQMLANRGYAVLSVNFRGSTGFGKGFINASNMEWSRKMHDDLLDAVQWAVDQGIADADRVAILGGSYGGYATLVGLTFTPDTFACGVDIVGPSSLVTLLESVPPYWQPMIDLFATRVGDHRTEEGRAELLKMSPLTYVDNIKRPLLIGQGANDPRVKQAESDQIVKTMQENETPVVYALYPDEGHGFARPENNLSFFALAEAFLARHIGGRYEPIGGDLDGSSLEIKTGRHEIPGLE